MAELEPAYGEVAAHLEGHVAVLEWSRPPSNHVTVRAMADLADALHAVDACGAARASVLFTGGRVFCAGADLTGDAGGALAPGPVNPLYVQLIRLVEARKSWVAAVQGAAVGAGLGLALAADFRVAGPEARFSANFVKLGFHPGFGISHLLERVVGRQRATLMQLTGRRIRAEQALEWGLADDLVPAEALRETAIALAAELAEGAPLAMAATRATLRADLVAAVQAATDREHAEQTRLRSTADFAEGVQAVAERRPGRFVGA